MPSFLRVRGSSALLVAAAALAAALPQAAAAAPQTTPVPTGAAAIAAVTTLLETKLGGPLPADEAVLSATYSPDGTHVAYRQAFDKPAAPSFDHNVGSDDWVMRADGTQPLRLTTTASWGSSASVPLSTADAVWAPDSSGLAYTTSGPAHFGTLYTRTFKSAGAADTWAAAQSYGDPAWLTDLAYTADSRWLVYEARGISSAADYAIDRSTATRYTARYARIGVSGWTWDDACATVTEGSYVPPVNSGNDVVDALSGATPACKFGVAPDPTAPSGTTPTPGGGPSGGTSDPNATVTVTSTTPHTTTPSSLYDNPGVSATTNRNLTPISDVAPIIPGPTLKITDVGTGLDAARRKGLHVKFSLDRLSTVKVWVIFTGTAARYSSDAAFAGVPASTVARGSIVSSKPGDGSLYAKFDAKGKGKLDDAVKSISLQVRMTATDVAGHTSTVVKSVRLRR